MAAFAPPEDDELKDELARYLSTDPEYTDDVLMWWHDHEHQYPKLSRMALDFLSIPGTLVAPSDVCIPTNKCTAATSVSVERVFSIGRLLLSHVRSRMSGQTTRALLCLKSWSEAGMVHPSDAKKVARLSEVEGDDTDYEMEEGWDRIDGRDDD